MIKTAIALIMGFAIGSSSHNACAANTALAYANTQEGGKVLLLAEDCVIGGHQYVVFNGEDQMISAGCWGRYNNFITARSNNGMAYRWPISNFHKLGKW